MLKTTGYRLLALCSLALGLVGIPLPGLPTVPFVLLSAWAAGKGWPQFEQWLLAERGLDIDHAREGGGLARALHYQVAPYIARGDLAIVLPGFEPAPSPVHALYPSARLLPARVRRFLDLALESEHRVY